MDYIGKDEVIETIKELLGEERLNEYDPTPLVVALFSIGEIPPANVEIVVRCKDCQKAEKYHSIYNYKNALMCNVWKCKVRKNDFCSRGERKGEQV